MSVYVGEDHPIYLEGLARALRQPPEFDVVGTSTDGRGALDEIRRLAPAVAVLDENMPGLLGNEVLHAISRDDLPTRVVRQGGRGWAFTADARGGGTRKHRTPGWARTPRPVRPVARLHG